MYVEPVGFDRDELARILRAQWGIEVAELRYEPVGFGTHHYRVRAADGTAWFVNVDELAAKNWLGPGEPEATGGLERALRTATALHEAGLEFIHAPHRHARGGCVAGMAGGYAISVFGVIEGESQPHGEFPDAAQRRTVLAALGRMHAATDRVPPDLPVRDNLEVPNRHELFAALRDPRPSWTGGPYAESTRRLIGAYTGSIGDLFARYDTLAPVVESTSEDWVVTHGEPHAANVMRTNGGGIKLIDWDTVKLGPRERDLWMIEPQDDEDWAAYRVATAADPAAMELYQLWWRLSGICGYVATFRAPHVDDENTRAAWRNLRSYL